MSTIHFLAVFKDLQLEHQYRQYHLKNEKIQLIVAICVFIIPNVLFVYSDYIMFGIGRKFYTLVTVRGIHLLVSIVLIFLIPHIKRTHVFDITTLMWWGSLISLIFYVNSTRPPIYVHHSVIDILVLFTIYILISNRLIFQVMPALLFSVGNIIFIATVKTDMGIVAFNVLWISYLVGNMLGIFVSWRLNVSRRLQFYALEKEKNLRKKLEKALSEVKSLRGIIPICSNCRKVRDDDGFWQQVEEYIADHSEAGFSHSLCPDCVKALYPKMYDKIYKDSESENHKSQIKNDKTNEKARD